MANLSGWESFVRVVESGTMAAAAQRLGCTRAQISKQIGDLEKQFGTALLERLPRKLRPTPAGEVFYQHALRTLSELQATELAMKNLGEQPHGIVRISATVTFGRLYIAPLLPKLVAQYPDLQCELILTDQLVNLQEDRIDLALRFTSSPPEDAIARQLFLTKRLICSSPSYLKQYGIPQKPSDLNQHRCFSYLMTDNNQWCLLDAQGQDNMIPVNNALSTNNLECLYNFILQGYGIGFLPFYLCGQDLKTGQLKSILTDYEPIIEFGRYLYACYTPSRSRLPKVKVLLTELEKLFHPTPPWEYL